MPNTLIIGYGNEIRGDDAVGPRIAALVNDWKLPAVTALAVHQLTPELAEPIAAAQQVVFVDASAALQVQEVQSRPLESATQCSGGGHVSHPGDLLALAQAVYGQCPPVWLITVPGERFEFGQSLSPRAEQGMEQALTLLRRFCERPDQ